MIRTSEVFGIAARGVLRNRRRTIITGTMIALGVIAVLFARGYIDGLQVSITASIIDTRFGSLQVSQRGYHASSEMAPLDVDLPADGPLVETLRTTPGITAVAGRLSFIGMISKGDTSQVFIGLGLDKADALVCPMGPASTYRTTNERGEAVYQLVDGPGLGADDGAILGLELAKSLDAKIGDVVTLVVQTRSGSVDAVDMHVVGIYGFDQPEDNRRAVVVPLALAQRVTHMKDRVTAFAARVPDRADIPRVASTLETRLARPELGATEVLTWEALGPYLRDVMRLQDRVLGVVMIVIFVLLLTGIANTMLMSVFERTREVGTLMCLGMRRRRILTLFVLEALLLTIVAALVGTLLGIVLVRIAHAIGLHFFIPAVGEIIVRPLVDTQYIAITLGAALASSLLAAVYPALRASRMNPVQALRAS